jgi:cytochrome bd-type quinol oxidase subunit 1
MRSAFAEMGRQPWVIYGQLSTVNAIQRPPLDQGVFGVLLYIVAYMLLGMALGLLSLRLIRIGPEAPLLAADWWKWLVREPRATEVEAL